ncbi:hypothetical protein ES703_59245 [subsurface metagenome]
MRNGTLILLTSSHEQIEHQHTVIRQFFPSSIDIDKGRFPDIRKVNDLLSFVGFRNIGYKEIHVEDIPIDHDYLHKVKGKYVSTYHLLPQKEFELGVEKLEAFVRDLTQPEFREWRGTLIRASKVVG